MQARGAWQLPTTFASGHPTPDVGRSSAKPLQLLRGVDAEQGELPEGITFTATRPRCCPRLPDLAGRRRSVPRRARPAGRPGGDRCCEAFQPAHMSGTEQLGLRGRGDLFRYSGPPVSVQARQTVHRLKIGPPSRPPGNSRTTAQRSLGDGLPSAHPESRMSKQDDCEIVSSGFSYRATGFRCCLSPLQNHIALSVKYGINLPLYLVDPPCQDVAAPHRNQVGHRAQCNRGRPPRSGSRGALSAARPLVPGPSSA